MLVCAMFRDKSQVICRAICRLMTRQCTCDNALLQWMGSWMYIAQVLVIMHSFLVTSVNITIRIYR